MHCLPAPLPSFRGRHIRIHAISMSAKDCLKEIHTPGLSLGTYIHFQTDTKFERRPVLIPSQNMDQILTYLYFLCRYNFQLSHDLRLIKEFLHLVISHLQVVRTVITITNTMKNFMLWFHYLCQMSYIINYDITQTCVNMHLDRNHTGSPLKSAIQDLNIWELKLKLSFMKEWLRHLCCQRAR